MNLYLVNLKAKTNKGTINITKALSIQKIKKNLSLIEKSESNFDPIATTKGLKISNLASSPINFKPKILSKNISYDKMIFKKNKIMQKTVRNYSKTGKASRILLYNTPSFESKLKGFCSFISRTIKYYQPFC